jgi:CRISPR-associated protein Cmr1
MQGGICVPTRLEAIFRVVTPLFCGGADGASAELRAPSLKGVLRFWWRAVAWPLLDGSLDEVYRREQALFGSAGAEGASKVRIAVECDGMVKSIAAKSPLTSSTGRKHLFLGARYLGYGLIDLHGNLERKALRAPLLFRVSMRLRDVSDADFELLVLALKALGSFGGLGARARRGFGSLVLQELRKDSQPFWTASNTVDGAIAHLEDLATKLSRQRIPPYTAFSEAARLIFVDAQTNDAVIALDKLGREFVRYRSWGKGKKVLAGGGIEGEPSEQRFKADHDLMFHVLQGKSATRYPVRVAFGLPHNYFFNSLPRGANKADVGPCSADRRASPLFFHVGMAGPNAFGVLLFLPAEFLPKGEKVSVHRRQVELTRDPKQLYAPVHGFLDRFARPTAGNGVKEQFGVVKEVGWRGE